MTIPDIPRCVIHKRIAEVYSEDTGTLWCDQCMDEIIGKEGWWLYRTSDGMYWVTGQQPDDFGELIMSAAPFMEVRARQLQLMEAAG
jgi:hypothetical protein